MRLVLHLDVNSYYATLEQQAYPNLRGKPVGIAGKGTGERTVMVGASIEAKRLGVKSVMPTWEARQVCPQLIILPANYDRYAFTSKRIFRILERFSNKVEIFSIDEAFIELDERLGFDGAQRMAEQIKQVIYTHIGRWVTCSIGISYGKTLAKLASERQKPNGLTVISPDNFIEIAQDTPIGDLCGIGFRLAPRLNRAGITTLYELGQADQRSLVKMFGPHTGNWFHRIGNGIDDNIVRSWHSLPQEKTIGHSYTLPRDIYTLEDAQAVMMLLAERVGKRMRRKELFASSVSCLIRFQDKGFWQNHLKLKGYLTDGYSIFTVGKQLLEDLPHGRPIRYLAISVGNIVKQVEVTRPFFEEDERKEKILKSIDLINEKFGELTIHRARLTKMRSRIFNLPDGRNKREFLPTASPFVKRMEG